jgi:hypothetical protein
VERERVEVLKGMEEGSMGRKNGFGPRDFFREGLVPCRVL